MDLQEKRDQLIDKNLCNHCLGRQFAKLGRGLENYERGAILKEKEDINENDFIRSNIPEDTELGGSCYLCNGLFDRLDYYVDKVVDSVAEYEMNTILVGTHFPQEIKKKQKELWQKYGKDSAKPIKSEWNRLVGKRVKPKLKVGVDYADPNMTFLIDIENDDVKLQIKSLFIYGKYNKYSREISQTEWMYSSSSVQEIVQTPFVDFTQSKEAKFHGAGREDVDVRCFGKREFVLELVKPKKRSINLQQLEAELNQSQSRVEVFALEFSDREQIKGLKEKRVDKIYRALVTVNKKVEEEELVKLEQVIGTIEQKTPERVKRSRGDRVRKRQVYKVAAELITEKQIDLIIKAEAGTYIKELISSDEGRTNPSVAKVLGCEAECTRLDVIDIDN
ncbi:tRNA pseudouridine(54/55) synthase Pus10 [Halanaerocella petrolearia]